MNVGYGNINDIDKSCLLCKGDIYVSKYQNDYYCINETCLLNKGHSKVVKLISEPINTILDKKYTVKDILDKYQEIPRGNIYLFTSNNPLGAIEDTKDKYFDNLVVNYRVGGLSMQIDILYG